MLCLPESIKEEREVVVIVQRLQGHLPRDPVAPAVMFEGDREVSAIITLPEGAPGRGPGLVGLARRRRRHRRVPLPRGDGEGRNKTMVVPVIRRELP